MSSAIATSVSKMFGKATFFAKKHGPMIGIIGGVIGFGAAIALMAPCTIKATKVLEEHKAAKADIQKCINDTEIVAAGKYNEEMYKKDIQTLTLKTTGKLVKVYWPAILLAILSATSILVGAKAIHKRNLALASAYTALDKGYREYQNRVKDKIGEDAEKELRYGIQEETVQRTVTDENGNEKTVEEKVKTVNFNGTSAYARRFDSSNNNYEHDTSYNRFFINSVETYANDQLNSRGYVFLNEIYDTLGLEQSVAGQSIGWYKSKNHDSHIIFRVIELGRDDEIGDTGYEKTYIIDFEPDGPILDQAFSRKC